MYYGLIMELYIHTSYDKLHFIDNDITWPFSALQVFDRILGDLCSTGSRCSYYNTRLKWPKLGLLDIHTMDMIWEKFQWILPLYMKPISFQLKASVVCLVTAAIFIDFCLKKLNVFSQHIGKKTNEYLNSTEQIPMNWNVDQLSMLIAS